jgi:Zn-finger nucleic acid-binding protein
MEAMICPKCQGRMLSHQLRDFPVHKCTDCGGIFLERADLGALSEAENDWHINSGPQTTPLPRITEDMKMPPPPPAPAARSFMETLFS